MTPPQHHH
uniref:Uncharacterized protein n=1 Tax=Anguilla anguilla TaxID=7936 RepID=A0A0E9W699_ANGAN